MKINTILFTVVISTIVIHTSVSTSSMKVETTTEAVEDGDELLLEDNHGSWWQDDDDMFEAGDALMMESAEEFLAMLSEEDHRALQYEDSYVRPRWWGRYKRLIGRPYLRRCKRWVEDHSNPPASGSVRCPRRNGNYTCFFGNQACPENGKFRPFPNPDQQCTCVDRVWTCQPWECPEPRFYKCPRKSPFESPQYPDGSMKCQGDMECSYGEETCCGETYPSLTCKCVNGEFACLNTDACMNQQCDEAPPVPSPPAPEPFLLDSCPERNPLETRFFPGCSTDLSCDYGEEPCCDGITTAPKVTCTCDANSRIECVPNRCAGIRCPPSEPFPPDFIPLPQIPPSPHGDTCTDATAVREVGTDCRCCGECVPDWICQCDGSKYECIQNVPFGLPCVCPADEPADEPADDPADEQADDPADEPVYILPFFPDPADYPDMHGEACEVEGSEETEGEDCSCCNSCAPDWRCTCTNGEYVCRKTFPPGVACSCAAESEFN